MLSLQGLLSPKVERASVSEKLFKHTKDRSPGTRASHQVIIPQQALSINLSLHWIFITCSTDFDSRITFLPPSRNFRKQATNLTRK